MTMMKILLTAFDPFGSDKMNSALEAVRLVPSVAGAAGISKLMVPTVFMKALDVVHQAMQFSRFDAVLSIGQAKGRAAVTPELVAINYMDARIKDNEGNQPEGQTIFADGPAAYFSNLPVKKIVSEIRRAGLPSDVSYSAGAFVCNSLMYGVLHFIATEFPMTKGGFIHVPCLPQQVAGQGGVPSMPLEDIVRSIEIALEVISEQGG